MKFVQLYEAYAKLDGEGSIHHALKHLRLAFGLESLPSHTSRKYRLSKREYFKLYSYCNPSNLT